MTDRSTSSRLSSARRWALLGTLASLAGAVRAQGMGGGMGGGGLPGMGGGPPNGERGSMPTTCAPKGPLAADLINRPDPWSQWREQLLTLKVEWTPEQLSARDALAADLRDAGQLYQRRRAAWLMQARPVVSARAPVDTDLDAEISASREWADALSDVASRWQALRATLDATLERRLMDGYAELRHRAASAG